MNDDPIWYTPEDPTPQYQCPCCDYVSLPERGNYLICPICYWEDDGQDLDQLDMSSEPNHGITLREARQNFQDIGACEKDMVKYVYSKSGRKTFLHKPRPDDEN
jgi:Cysteine-rich CPCC